MRIEKKHKIYAGLVGAALVAWGIDATFFQPPAANVPAAGAAVAPQGPDVRPALPSAVSSSDSPADEGNKWLATRLRAWSAKNPGAMNDVRDVFSAPGSWAPQKSIPVTAPPQTAEKIVEAFRREHHLTAVILDGSGGSALIDGRLLHVGQSVGGCRLRAVSRGCADWVAPDGREFRVLIGPEAENSVK
jgi:hypothetical protein